jgi:hypothetical protein
MVAVSRYAVGGSLLMLTLLIAACGEDTAVDPVAPAAPAPAAAVMLGAWSYANPARAPSDAPSLNVGLLVTLTIDSADGSNFHGTVIWFAGDVGAPPGTFGPVAGTVGPRGHVTLVIPVQRAATAPLVLVARVVADTLTVDHSSQGTEAGPFATGDVFVRFDQGGLHAR